MRFRLPSKLAPWKQSVFLPRTTRRFENAVEREMKTDTYRISVDVRQKTEAFENDDVNRIDCYSISKYLIS